MKKKAGIPAGERVTMVTYPPRRTLFEVIMKRSPDDMLESKLAQLFGRMPYRAWIRGGFLRITPYWVDVR